MLNQIFEYSFLDSSALDLKFENAARYNSELKYTFFRTISDINEIKGKFRILEVGSFTGVVSIALSRLGHDVTASDIDFVINDPGLVDFYRKEGIQRCPVNLASGKFPQPDGVFDLIVFNEVLEHLNFNPIPLLKEFNRLLINGGRVYCATPNLLAAKNVSLIFRRKGYLNSVEALVSNLQPNSGMSVGLHWREWAKDELIDLFTVAGFKLESHKFGLTTQNRSRFPRKQLVSLMYKIWPSLMPNQAALFQKMS
jgi:SAM-dependent methyltransferase